MTHVEIGVLKQDLRRLLAWLQEEEILHVAPKDQAGEHGQESEINHEIARLQGVLEFLEEVRKELGIKKQGGMKALLAKPKMALLEDLQKAREKMNLEEVVRLTQGARDDLGHVKARVQELLEEGKSLAIWKNLNVTGTDLETQNVAISLIKISDKAWQELKKELSKIKTCDWQEVASHKSGKRIIRAIELVADKQDEVKLKQTIAKSSAEIIELQLNLNETVSQKLDSIKKELAQLKTMKHEIMKSAKTWLKQELEWQMAYDALLHEQARVQITRGVVLGDLTAVISGWIPSKAFRLFSNRLELEFEGAAVERTTPHQKTQPPVLIDNVKSVAPFEAVTNIYGKPRYSELDPSPILAIFFLTAFGLALTDAGYGLLMAGGTWLADKFLALPRETRKMVRLLHYAGWATVVIGALAGGWFGITLENLPAGWLKDGLLSLKIIDPVTEPIKLLLVAFGLGILQLLFAWLVAAYDNYRKKDYFAMIFDNLAWISMVVSLLVWALLEIEWVGWLAVVNAGVLTLTQGRSYKNIFVKIGAGALSLYGLINFLSDVLSYSRLLALGLATGIIGLVVNLMSGMVLEMVPVVGIILAVVVLIVGHGFNLGINALGAFIHSGRLQFVEFFPKFMEGGGVPYRPIGRVGKYLANPSEYDS